MDKHVSVISTQIAERVIVVTNLLDVITAYRDKALEANWVGRLIYELINILVIIFLIITVV